MGKVWAWPPPSSWAFFMLPAYSCDFDPDLLTLTRYPDLTLTLLSFIPSVSRDPVEGVHLMRDFALEHVAPGRLRWTQNLDCQEQQRKC